MSAIEHQITEIQAGLSEYRSKISYRVEIFRLGIIPTSAELKEELGLLNWLMQHDSPALAYVLNNLNYNKFRKSIVSNIGILPLLIATICIALFIYYNYSSFTAYKLAILSCSIVAILIMVAVELFNLVSGYKNAKCTYLVETAIKIRKHE